MGRPRGRRGETTHVPIDLELAIGVLVVSLVRPPPQRLHVLAQLANQVVLAHEGVRVVARLGLDVVRVGEGCRGRARGQSGAVDEKKLAFNS